MRRYLKVVGIDENGLGPKLGPLTVTGALFECAEGYEHGAFFEALAEGAGGAGRVNDSKAVMGFRKMAHGEEIVLGLTVARCLWVSKVVVPAATCPSP